MWNWDVKQEFVIEKGIRPGGKKEEKGGKGGKEGILSGKEGRNTPIPLESSLSDTPTNSTSLFAPSDGSKPWLFRDGNNANPSGRAKETPWFKDALKKGADRALQIFLDMLEDPDVSDELKVRIGTYLMDRKYGKAKQIMEVDSDKTITHKLEILSNDDFIRKYAKTVETSDYQMLLESPSETKD